MKRKQFLEENMVNNQIYRNMNNKFKIFKVTSIHLYIDELMDVFCDYHIY